MRVLLIAGKREHPLRSGVQVDSHDVLIDRCALLALEDHGAAIDVREALSSGCLTALALGTAIAPRAVTAPV